MMATVGAPEGARQTSMFIGGSQAVSLLLELAIRVGSQTARKPAPGSISEALRSMAMATQINKARLTADRAARGLLRIDSLAVQHDGTLDVGISEAPPFKFEAFHKLYLARMADTDRGEADTVMADSLMNTWREGSAMPTEMVEIDAGLRAPRGHGLAALVGGLSGLQAMARTDPALAGYRSPSAKQLATTMTSWVERRHPLVPFSEISRALDSGDMEARCGEGDPTTAEL
jgi:hypothetical protein